MVIDRIAVLTSGGDSQGMNAAVSIIVRVATQKGIEVLGVKNGYQGLIDNNFQVLTNEDVVAISHLGGTFLGTARCEEFKTQEGVEKGIENLKKNGVDALIVIGGDGSFKGVCALNKYRIKTIAIPATIDNDISYTDRCLGFDTAVNNAVHSIESIKQTMAALNRCSIIEVMGRHCGDIALYCASATAADVLALPEKPTTEEEVIEKIKMCIESGKKSPTVIVAEHMFDVEKLAKKVQEQLNIETKSCVLGYIQRGGSPSVYDRTLAVQMGVKAVDLVARGEFNRAIGIKGHTVIDVDMETALNSETNFNYDLLNIFISMNS